MIIWNGKCYEIVWNYDRCYKIGEQLAINIEHHVHWFYIQINFMGGGSFTTYYYRLCFLKRGAIYIAFFGYIKSLECDAWNMGLVFTKELIISKMFFPITFNKLMLTLFVPNMFQNSSLCPIPIV